MAELRADEDLQLGRPLGALNGHGGEAGTGFVLNRAPTALSEVSSPVLTLWLLDNPEHHGSVPGDCGGLGKPSTDL